MKKILLFAILLGICKISLAQNSVEQYCEMVVSRSVFSESVNAKLVYGQNSLIISSDKVKDKKDFPTLSDALNFMGAAGWKLVTYTNPEYQSNKWRFIFKKEVDLLHSSK